MATSCYTTTDLSLAAALRNLLSRTPSVHLTSRLAEFRFTGDPAQAQRVADEYYSDRLTVNPRQYAQDLRDLKTLIFQARNENGH